MYNNIEDLDKKYIWHPFTQMKGWLEHDQMTITHGRGIYLYDNKGNAYYDGVSSLWVNIHGHNVPEINNAIEEQLQNISHSTLLGLMSPPSALLAEKLVKITPPNLTKVFYSDDGSTGIEAALKMAYQYWQLVGKPTKKKFITFTSAYHGDTLGTVSVGGIRTFHKTFSDLLFTPLLLPSPEEYNSIAEKEATYALSLKELERILKVQHHEIAALIIEPLVQAAAGMLTMPDGYLRKVRDLTKAYHVLLIADEVATGFGRTGKMFACNHEDVEPDFMVLSKGITGGYLPLAATLTTDEVFHAFLGEVNEGKTFYHGHSYTGNALACAAALANLKLFDKTNLLEKLPHKVQAVATALEPIKDLSHVKEVRQKGLMIGIVLIADKAKNIKYDVAQAMGAKVALYARSKGLIIRPIGDTVILLPPLASSGAELLDMVRITMEAIIAVTEEEFATENIPATEL